MMQWLRQQAYVLWGDAHKRRWLLLIAVALPGLSLAAFVVRYSVNVPFWDQWELVPLLQKYQHGTLGVHDLWLQHNEHRLFFPQLLMVISAVVTHWNTRVECLISVVIAACSFILIYKLVTGTGRALAFRARWLTPALATLASLVWFSPVQVENWLWGWQIQWFLSVLGAVAVAYAVTRVRKGQLPLGWLAVLLIGGIVAQYSLGNGTLIWPLAIFSLAYLRVSRWQIAAVMAVGIGGTALYYHKYANPSSASQAFAFDHPSSLIHYGLIYLGRPLTYVHGVAAFFGLIACLLFFGLSVYFFLCQKAVFRIMLPWIVLGLYAAGTAIITGLGRLGMGLNEAYSSRYTTVSSLFLLSCIVMAATFVARQHGRLVPTRRRAQVLVGLLTGVTSLVLLNAAWGVHSGIEHNREMRSSYNCTHSGQLTQVCLLSIYPNADTVYPRLEYLKRVHWGGY